MLLLFPKPLDYGHGENRRELAHASAEADDLANEAAAGEGVLLARHNEHGFDAADRAVGQRKLELVAKVRDVADATEDRGGASLADKIDGQPDVLFDANAHRVV